MKKITKKLLLSLLSLLMIFAVAAPLMARDGEAFDGGLEYHVSLGENPVQESLTFIDSLSEVEWVGVEARECIHGMWGIDVLYHLGSDYKWVCHGSWTLEGYSVLGQTDIEYGEHIVVSRGAYVDDKDIDAVTLRQEMCPRECGGVIQQISQLGPAGRIGQRNCIHFAWGVDIQYQQITTITRICNRCGTHWGTINIPNTWWVCYGFN
jgi:ribosomal protein S27AE